MSLPRDELTARLTLPQYPRSAKHDPEWVIENLMGPNVLWLTEALAGKMDLQPGMKVLDMGCGKAVSSIFLAREFGVLVWATDLWIGASENLVRVREVGLEARVFPIHAEAHSLPFADGFFDAAVSLDAYHYFGTDDLYMGRYYAKLIRPGGQIGITVPGVIKELPEHIPEAYQAYWEWDYCSFHTPAWWKHNWERCGLVRVEHADTLPDGWREWLLWHEVCDAHNGRADNREAELVRMDRGRTLGFTRVVGRRV